MQFIFSLGDRWWCMFLIDKLRKRRRHIAGNNEKSLARSYPQTLLGKNKTKLLCHSPHHFLSIKFAHRLVMINVVTSMSPFFYAELWAIKRLSPVEELLLSRITYSFAPSHALAHGKYIFQKQRLKFIFQAVESACLTLIQFFSQGTSGVELKCTKLRYRFFCLFEPGIRSLEEFVRGGWEIMCVESEFHRLFADLNGHTEPWEVSVNNA